MTCVSKQLASPKAGMEPGFLQTTHNRINFINYTTNKDVCLSDSFAYIHMLMHL